MSNVIQMRFQKSGSGNAPNTIFLAKVLATGPSANMYRLCAMLLESRSNERDGRYAVVGRTLFHLAGWSRCQATVNTMNASMDLDDPDEADRTKQLRGWPHDVSAWPSVILSDAPGEWHMDRDMWEEAHADQ